MVYTSAKRIYLVLSFAYSMMSVSIILGLPENTEKTISQLATIPIEDRGELELLFKKLFLNDHFAYTLLDGKAISITAITHEVDLDDLLSGSRKGRLFWNKWETWVKYRSQFPTPNFLLIKEESKNVEGTSWIVFINKQVFVETINNHRLAFQEVLGKVTPQELLRKLESDNVTLQDIVQGSDLLLGILLGYGEHNCRIYDERKRNEQYRNTMKCLLNQTLVSSISKEEIENRVNSFRPINYQSYILKVNPVSFCADTTHRENKQLGDKYQNLNEAISKLYKDRDVLETTLSLMMQHSK